MGACVRNQAQPTLPWTFIFIKILLDSSIEFHTKETVKLPEDVQYEIVTKFTNQLKQTNTVRTKVLLYQHWVPFDCRPSSAE